MMILIVLKDFDDFDELAIQNLGTKYTETFV